MEIVFLWPFVAVALLLPIIIRFYMKAVEYTQFGQALSVPFFHAVQHKKAISFGFYSNFVGILFSMAYLALIVAAMRPVSFDQTIYIPSKSRQMMLVLDVSDSMRYPDFIWNNRRTTRLNAVQNIADDFIQSRKGDAVGLTIFGTQAYLYTPLTLDTQTAASMLSEIGVGIAGTQTAMGDALALALKQMKDIPSDKKVIVLLSDGDANAGVVHPLEIIEPAQNNQVKIHTVGLGSTDGTFDEKLLQQIASQTGGQYFRVRTTSDLQKMYDEINKLEPIEIDGIMIRPKTELFWIPLGISMMLFFVGLFLKERKE